MPDADPGPLLRKTAPDLGPDVALLAEAVVEAGATALKHFRRDPRVWMKAGDSPVSEADLEADRLLHARLLGARPAYGWLSEETADNPGRLDRTRVFVVDPIDGTRAFIAGEPVWAVSAAVVEAGRPVAGALYQPATGDLMLAAAGRGAWRGGERLSVSGRRDLQGARVAGPRRFFERPEPRPHDLEAHPFVPSLALRVAWVATGRLDLAVASARSHDWDLAASDLLVHEAGGRLVTAEGAPLAYNAAVPRHPALAAMTPGLAAPALALLGAMAYR
ncbi:3'(2'),5'-bisphosphate nucleotidase CysQ [Prosthecomicrobium sp. N25]|uniref:3'(2'),5'-bisphosphate nucleotidase CysQ n=1 Tax=Prosthecomicrobium sp. N25 TaxID=3129254 RepID=UPI003076CA9F